jgi:prepilin-type N-terminal cleavage/methylation domain-containing protein
MKQSTLPSQLDAPLRSKGFTLIELLTVIAIIGVLAAILIPAMGKVRERAMVTKKTSAYRQYFIANTMYASDHKGRTCPAKDVRNGGDELWQVLLAPYLVGDGASTNKLEIFIDPFYEEYDVSKSYLSGVGINIKIGLPENSKQNVYWNEEKIDAGSDFLLGNVNEPARRIFIGDSLNWFINEKKAATDRQESGTKGMFTLFDGSVVLFDAEEAVLSITDPAKLRGR